MGYCQSWWTSLVRYLDHAGITPDNKAAERAVGLFVVGRENWIMSGSPAGVGRIVAYDRTPSRRTRVQSQSSRGGGDGED
ncbi:IS66 family transposase [Alkalispirochaeta sphaeroplastigenens]|uniref:IS66 family transposase n=1 Tax=Alkalispirochaeta sphaeroplastigenens TaxID=1187066 RepID=UPI0034DB66BD